MRVLIWILTVSLIMIAGCASSNENQISNEPIQKSNNNHHLDDGFDLLEEELNGKVVKIGDPLEPVNRLMFGFNDVLYFWAVKPVAKTYKNITPKPARLGVSNFFENLTTPIRFTNSHLQGKSKIADVELKRFLINSTVGVLGFGDPAKDRYNIEPAEKEDLGQTLAVYGFGNGFYLVLPVFGPSTLRDTAGRVGDRFLNPITYVEPDEASIGISAFKFTNYSSFHLGEYESFKEAALDPYVAMRQAYVQYRNELIKK